MKLKTHQITQIFELIQSTIEAGLQGKQPGKIRFSDPDLNQLGAAFVTLHLHGQLRGCIGSLVAHRPLIEDIAHHAYSAAFRDPRFAPVTPAETVQLEIEFSVLSEPEAIYPCNSRQNLIDQLTPGVDGLILSRDSQRATFLPSVWKQLPNADDFVDHLMRKAGMSGWSADIQCQRYSVVAFEKNRSEI